MFAFIFGYMSIPADQHILIGSLLPPHPLSLSLSLSVSLSLSLFLSLCFSLSLFLSLTLSLCPSLFLPHAGTRPYTLTNRLEPTCV